MKQLLPDRYHVYSLSLRSRLLLLTILFVMLVEAVIYLPSLATFRQNFLIQRVTNAQIAALSLKEAANHMISPTLEESLLTNAGVIAIYLSVDDQSLLLGAERAPAQVAASYDLRSASLGPLVVDALATLQARGDRVIRVIGTPTVEGARFVELTLHEGRLFAEMSRYSNNILILSLIVSLFTAVLIYLALHWLVVRPIRRVERRITEFRERPDYIRPPGKTVGRRDEIGMVARELVYMQGEIRESIQQKTRLAELGEAVAKINHDLRNILATAQLSSDALKRLDDPRIKRITDRLLSAVSRAVALCERTMAHGKVIEAAPDSKWVSLHQMVDEVAEALLGSDETAPFRIDNLVPADMTVYADEALLHRVLLNLARNAQQAQNADGLCEVTANKEESGAVHIRLRDEGPGIAQQVIPNLFKAFNSAGRKDGTGLGLSIAREIILAHGGQIGLLETGDSGTSFLICLPGEED